MSNNSNNLTNDTSNNNDVVLRWEVAIAKFLEHLRGKSYSPFTIKTRKQDLERYVRWCEERAIISPVEITQQDLERYQASLTLYRNRSGKILDLQSQSRVMGALRTFYRYLYKSNHIAENPAIELEGPRLGRRIPRRVLTLAEVELMLRQPNLGTMAGLRDRAILETLYSTGIRRMELVNLRISDINFETGELRVLSGKGNKDRSIPIGERALAFIEKYLQEVRPTLLINGKDEGYLFLTHEGKQISADVLVNKVVIYKLQAGIDKSGACHLFRHTCATLMLEGGADIRYIQQMLGHEQLSTTQIYTHVTDRKLKEVHSQTHPGASLSGTDSQGNAINCAPVMVQEPNGSWGFAVQYGLDDPDYAPVGKCSYDTVGDQVVYKCPIPNNRISIAFPSHAVRQQTGCASANTGIQGVTAPDNGGYGFSLTVRIVSIGNPYN